MCAAIGIDLGTTNSCAAVMVAGQPHVITTPGGQNSIPSVFAIDAEGNELVGAAAKAQAQANPLGTIAGAKRLIGRNFHSKSIDQTRQIFTYEMVEGADEEVLIQVQQNLYTLEQISAAILTRVRDVAEAALETRVTQAVITVPAYFNERQRRTVREAGHLAGLQVLRVLNEPTAAALAYGLGKQLTQRVAVYDLGGGTFDISIIDIKGRVYEVVATGGDTFLGGVDFDGRLMRHLLETFHEVHGIDLSIERVAVQRIRDAAEATKIALSTHEQAIVQLPSIATGPSGPIDLDITVTRGQLETMTRDLVDRTIDTCRQIFADAATSPDQIDEILMVGGQSHKPLVRQAVSRLMGQPVRRLVDPEQAVGLGAAIMAAAVKRPSSAPVTLRDVLPIPIGLHGAGGIMHILFDKNTRLPARRIQTLTTSKDGQRSIMLRMYQGEHRDLVDNDLIGSFVFSGIRNGGAGRVGLEVTFDLDAEGNLRVAARDPDTDDQVMGHMKVDPTGRKPPPPRPRRVAPRPAPITTDDELLPAGPHMSPLSMPNPQMAPEIELDPIPSLPDSDGLRYADPSPPLSWFDRLGNWLRGNG